MNNIGLKNKKNIKKVIDNILKIQYTMTCQQRLTRMVAQLSWESICLTSRGSQVRALQRPPFYGPVVQLVRTLACHARGRRFEPVPGRHSRERGHLVSWPQHFGAPAQIAQLVEQWTENPRVAGSIPALGTIHAGIAHLVERHLAKVEVASSSLVARSRL